METKQKSNLLNRAANFILGVAVLTALYRFIVPGYGWVHPHFYYDILPQSLANGSSIKLRDFIDIFQPRQDFEVRSRFINYLVLSFDQKIRLFSYDNFYIPSNFLPIISTLNIVSCFLFYKTLKIVFQEKIIAKIGLSLYIVSIGFYSLSGNVYMAAKPVANFIVIYSMFLTAKYLAGQIKKIKFFITNLILLFIGFYTDEVVFIVVINYLLIVGLFYLRDQKESNLKLPPIKNKKIEDKVSVFIKLRLILGVYFLALFAWIISISFIVPVITKKYFGWDFSFWQFNLNLKNDINFGGGFPEGTKVDLFFIIKNSLSNIYNIFSYQFVPEFLFSANGRADLQYGQPNSLYRFGDLTAPGFIVLILVLLSISYVLIKKPSKAIVLTFLTFVSSVVFFSLLQLKHVPQISGYIYGATISVYMVFFLTTVLKSISVKDNLNFATLTMIMFLLFVQIANGNELNKRWDLFHRNWSNSAIQQISSLPTSTLGAGIRTSIDVQPKLFEDFQIWRAFHNNSLEQYLETNSVSLKSMAFITELRLGSYAKKLNDGDYHCDIAGLQLPCLGYIDK